MSWLQRRSQRAGSPAAAVFGVCVLSALLAALSAGGCDRAKPVRASSAVSKVSAVSMYSAPQVPYPQVLAGIFEQNYPHLPFAPRYQRAKAENSDTVGWLFVPGTTIDLPVTQTTDNAYYLKHGLNKQYKWKGNPFLDFRDTAASRMQIIYGHNMGDGDLFGQLKKYMSLSFLNKYPLIYYSDGTADRYFKIFSVFITNLQFDYNEPNFTDNASFMGLVSQFQSRSFYKTKFDVTASDTLLMLSTCTYEFHNARFVVVAREVHMAGEESLWDAPAVVNPNPSHYYDD